MKNKPYKPKKPRYDDKRGPKTGKPARRDDRSHKAEGRPAHDKDWNKPRAGSEGRHPPKDKDWNKPRDKAQDRPARDKDWSKPREKSWEKPRGKTWDKPREKSWDKPQHAKGGDRGRDKGRPKWADKDRGPAPEKQINLYAGLNANLWGVHAVTEAWLNPARDIKKFFTTDMALAEFRPVMERAQAAGLTRPAPTITEKAAMDRALTGAVHQGLAVEAAPLDEIFVQDLAVRAAAREKTILVMLDQVTDPHNVGAVMRSASAFGASGLIMQSRHAPEITGTLAKAACGAVEHIPLAYETNLSRTIEFLQEQGFTAIGLAEQGENTLAEIEVPDKVLIVLGAEGKGMRHNLREHCNVLVRLPTQGAILSLNVSNAAAVALYALVAR
jgi:23S rRNA (guanosine2251-2'-O)-methyltransferase